MSLFVFFISLLIVAQHVSGNHVPIIRSWRLRDVIASCWYVPWLREGCQDRLAGSASMDGFVARCASAVGLMMICCGMAVKRMGILRVSVRMMRGHWLWRWRQWHGLVKVDRSWHALCIKCYFINSKIFFLSKHFTFVGSYQAWINIFFPGRYFLLRACFRVVLHSGKYTIIASLILTKK